MRLSLFRPTGWKMRSIGFAPAAGAKPIDRIFQPVGRNNDSLITGVNAQFGQPVSMNTRGQRVSDRPADDSGAESHLGITPSWRRKSRSGSNGSPKIVK